MFDYNQSTSGLCLVTCIYPKYLNKNDGWINFIKEIIECHAGHIHELLPPQKNWHGPKSYINEMRSDLSNIIFVTSNNIDFKQLSLIKNKLVEIEDYYSLDGRRTFNLNPGMLSINGLSLASHKPSNIRNAISKDVWIERQLVSENEQLKPMSNTFSEFLYSNRIHLLNQIILSKKNEVLIN